MRGTTLNGTMHSQPTDAIIKMSARQQTLTYKAQIVIHRLTIRSHLIHFNTNTARGQDGCGQPTSELDEGETVNHAHPSQSIYSSFLGQRNQCNFPGQSEHHDSLWQPWTDPKQPVKHSDTKFISSVYYKSTTTWQQSFIHSHTNHLRYIPRQGERPFCLTTPFAVSTLLGVDQ